MKILTLDVGNTTIDACSFEGGEIKPLGRFSEEEVEKLPSDHDLVAVVSVRESVNAKLREVFGEKFRLIRKEDIPIEIDYKTPETLGVDRVMFAYGVREIYSKDAVLVMCGTALVVDLILDGKFMGGFITAGVGFKLRTLAEKTEGLPHLKPEILSPVVGKSTRECLLGGVYRESLSFIKDTTDRWCEEFKRELPVFITGGEGHLFESLGTYDPIILHRSMHIISLNRSQPSDRD